MLIGCRASPLSVEQWAHSQLDRPEQGCDFANHFWSTGEEHPVPLESGGPWSDRKCPQNVPWNGCWVVRGVPEAVRWERGSSRGGGGAPGTYVAETGGCRCSWRLNGLYRLQRLAVAASQGDWEDGIGDRNWRLLPLKEAERMVSVTALPDLTERGGTLYFLFLLLLVIWFFCLNHFEGEKKNI